MTDPRLPATGADHLDVPARDVDATSDAEAAGNVEAAATDRSLVITLGTGPTEGATVAALRLADAAAQRGHRVTIYAYGEGVRVGAASCPTSSYVQRLLGDDGTGESHDATTDHDASSADRATWIVDAQDPRTSEQVAGVVRGDGSDLWRAVRDGDVVLGVTA